ncbi:MAG: aminopeptidase P N-terminal domain-containing protein [Candidatus Aminicenantes bacterium]|nr:aminopeptidase P N-terminal domain-containing protein [Candidatus Aminicenantes bacterium]
MIKKKHFSVLIAIFLCFFSLSAQPIDKDIFVLRRQKVLDQLEHNSIAILRNSKPVIRNNDQEYFFRSDSNFYYLTGLDDPESVLVLIPYVEQQFILFVKPRNLMDALWHGDLPGIDGAVQTFGADKAYALDQFQEMLRTMVTQKDVIYMDYDDKELYEMIVSIFPYSHGVVRPRQLQDLLPLIQELRVYKGPEEIALLSKAVQITCDGLIEVMKAFQPGMYEYEAGAILEYVFRSTGSPRNGFSSILGSGPNATVLHYQENTRQTQAGDLLLMDVGAEYGYYTADITRTIPVSGRFTKEQKEIYQIVLDAQEAGIKEMVPGKSYQSFLDTATDVAKDGLFQLGLITDRNSNWQHLCYFFHGVGHWLGMDVHDVGDYEGEKIRERLFEPGMVSTIEPGLYISENMRKSVFIKNKVPEDERAQFLKETKEAFERYKNIGIRIEDDILITENGNRILSNMAPREIVDIERMMQKNSIFNQK